MERSKYMADGVRWSCPDYFCCRSFRDNTITVIVGEEPDSQEFIVYGSVVSKSSQFFRTALNGNWSCFSTKRIELKGNKPETFNFYLNWAYHHILPAGISEVTKETSDSQDMKLAMAYVLGEYLQDVKFQDGVLDTMTRKYIQANSTGVKKTLCKLPSTSAVSFLYANASAKSPIRKLLTEMYADSAESFDTMASLNETKDLLREFLMNLVLSLITKRCQREQWKDLKCRCHAHALPNECYLEQLPAAKRQKTGVNTTSQTPTPVSTPRQNAQGGR